MATIYIDEHPYEVKEDQNLLKTCLALGFNIPYFCWHPALHAVGSCRLCAVKEFRDEHDTHGRIVMSCMTPVADGMRISISDPEVKEFRAAVLEWLMINHPHDCPVCDEGGECHLQDMTVMTGHTYRRHRFRKNTHANQDLGPCLNHEMNRCIQCYRCVRFYRDYAGGDDLNAFGVHNRLYFGRFQSGTLESEFSGNLVEICPTGVFTDKTFRAHFTRKWDLQTAPSVCVHCGVGCCTIPGERYGILRRIRNRYNDEVNGYFLCDRGRFGYEFVNSERRLRHCSRRDGSGTIFEMTSEESEELVTVMLGASKGVIGIGSPRAPLEANFALRALVGPDRFCSGLSEKDLELVRAVPEILRSVGVPSRSLREVEASDSVLILGEDVTNTAPRMALSMRQSVLNRPARAEEEKGIPRWNDRSFRHAIQDDRGPLYVASTCATPLDDLATNTFHATPSDIARLGFAVARELDETAPAVEDLSPEMKALARTIATDMKAADKPLVVSGASCGELSVMHAAANVAAALRRLGCDAGLSLILPECNSMGAAMMDGGPLEAAMQNIKDGTADTVVIVENDLYRRLPSHAVDEFLDSAKHVIVIDHVLTRTGSRANVALAAATFAESDGTLVNSEGRAQRFFKVLNNSGEVKESRRWLSDMLVAIGRGESLEWDCVDAVARHMARELSAFEKIPQVAAGADFRVVGQKIPRQAHRYSGRTSMYANVNVHEQKPTEDNDSALAFSMEGYRGIPPVGLTPRYWAPGWNSVQALNKFQSEIAGPLVGGHIGLRLIEAGDAAGSGFMNDVPEAFQPVQGEWLIVPHYEIFGSEELSVLSFAIAQRSPDPYVGLNPADAETLGINEGQEIDVVVQSISIRVAARLISSLPAGVAALTARFAGLEAIALPARGTIVPVAPSKKGPE